MTETEHHRALALKAFDALAKGDTDFLRTVIAEDFIEHSPDNPSGRDAFVDFLANSSLATAKLDLKRIVADGPYVVVHYSITEPGDTNRTAVVDILRFENGQIAEHWDVVQAVPDPDRTPNGMF